jgi:DNA-binding beta-propeller fold protein YncE
MGLAFDSSGNLYVADYKLGLGRILKFDPNGNASVFATGTLLRDPYALTFDVSGNLYVLNDMDNSIVKIDPGGKQSMFVSTVYPDAHPVDLTFDSSGNLYVAIDNVSTIMKFNSSGTGSVFVTESIVGGGGDMNGLAIDSSGNLYTSVYGGNRIVKCDPSGNVSLFAGASAGLDGPGFMAVQIPEPSSLLLGTGGTLLLWPLLKRKRA